MSLASRLGAVALAVVLIAGVAPTARPVLAADQPTLEPQLAGGRGAPDPVTFVPEAGRREEILRRPEAMIGFASRELLTPRRRLVDPSTIVGPRTDTSMTPSARPKPSIDPSSSAMTERLPQDDVEPADPPALASDPVGSGAAGFVQLAAVAQVTGVIRGPGATPLAGMRVCLDVVGQYASCVAFDLTDANGAYAIDAGPGSYLVRSFEPVTDSEYVPGYWRTAGFTHRYDLATTVVVVSSNVSGIDISHPLFPRIRGTLVDSDGDPIVGHTVTASSSWSDQTDVEGDFAIKVWPESEHRITVGYSTDFRGGYYTPGGLVDEHADATVIAVGTGDVTGIEITVPRWPRIRGVVKGADGAPLAGVSVWDVRLTYPSDTTDEAGTFDIPAQFQDEWRLMFSKDGYKNRSIDLTVTEDVDLEVVLHRYPHVSGVVTDLDGNPIPGMGVSIQAGIAPHDHWTATTDVNGAFSVALSTVLPTSVSIRYQAIGSTTWIPGVLGDDGWTLDQDERRSFPADLDDEIDASVSIPAYVPLTGTVRHASGAAVQGGWIGVFRPDGLHASVSGGQIGEDGRYAALVVPGDLVIVAPGGYVGQEGFAYVSGAATPIVVGHQGRQVDVTLPAGRSIKGRVTRNGVGVAGIEVDVFLEGSPFAAGVTAADGTYAIAVPPGAYLVGFYDPKGIFAHGWYGPSGYVSDPDVAQLVGVGGAADATGVDVSLLATKRVSGRVVALSSTTNGVDYAFVEAFVNGVYYSSQYAKADGTFNLPVAPGKVTLWVWDPNLGYAPGWRTATSVTADPAAASVTTVTSGNVTGITIKLPAAVGLRLLMERETQPGHHTSVDAAVTAVAYGTSASFSVLNEDGTRYMPLLKGTYLLWVDANQAQPLVPDGWSKGTTLTADAATATRRAITAFTTVSITVPKGGRLSGTVSDRFERSVAGIDVQLFAAGSFYLDEVSETGYYEFTVLPGTYRVAYVDMLGRHRTGWHGTSGFVADYVDARNVAVAKEDHVSGVDVGLPMQSPPSSPTGVVASPFHRSALVRFTPSPSTPTRPIVHHMVTATPGGRQCVTTGSSCTVTGLVNGTAYTFRVTASSIVGPSAPSAPSAAVTPKAVPNAPGAVTATASGSTVSVSWTAPSGNGSAITSYLATLSPGGQSCTPSPATATSCTLTGIVDGRYSVAVTASSAVGTGPARSASVTVDTVAPVVTAPVTSLRTGVSMSGTSVPVTVAWTATDPLAGIADTTLERAVGTGTYVELALPSTTAVSLATTLPSSATPVRFRDRAKDASGNWSGNATGPLTYVTLRQETGTGIVYSGTWATASTTSALGGKLRYTSTKNASVTYTFTGRGVSFVTRKGSTSGKAAVYLDGVLVTTLDLHSSSSVVRWVAYAKTNPTSAKHVLKIVNLATSGRPRLYVDGFATVR